MLPQETALAFSTLQLLPKAMPMDSFPLVQVTLNAGVPYAFSHAA